MNIVQAADKWTRVTPTLEARIWAGRLWRKESHPVFIGGYQIKSCVLDSHIAREWLLDWERVYATCAREIADMIDPNGSLRRAGLLFVQ